MCDRNKSCSVIEDEGLQAAYTLAHELGNAQPLVFFLFCFFLCVCFLLFSAQHWHLHSGYQLQSLQWYWGGFGHQQGLVYVSKHIYKCQSW